jgi:hypothetical protein
MSDPNSVPEPVSAENATTEISFCPHLGIYHYKRQDGTEYFFDTEKLEQSINTYLKEGLSQEADFMIQLTAWGRKFPHKVATFHADGSFTVRKLEPIKSETTDETESPE